MARRFCFDDRYYDRFYRDPHTRVSSSHELRRRGAFVCSYLQHLDQPVHSVLDLGCGLGGWRAVIARHFPTATYRGVELSEYMCREHGWQHGSVVDYTDRPADLVICQGVLQYLTASEARAAIANLARLCGGALYLEVLCREDWETNCDQSVTDGDVHLRDAGWYRRALSKKFTNVGGGVYLGRHSPVVMYELEKME